MKRVNGMEVVKHTFDPIYDQQSKVLILGTMPSPKSRSNGFYYGHPQNRFWRTITSVFKEQLPLTNEEKISFLKRHHLALWDVLKSCEIEGASDASIKNPIPNDLNRIIRQSSIIAVFTTGKKAAELYMKFCYPDTKIPCIVLPSTSPANRRIKDEQLEEEYSKILKYV